MCTPLQEQSCYALLHHGLNGAIACIIYCFKKLLNDLRVKHPTRMKWQNKPPLSLHIYPVTSLTSSRFETCF